MAFPAEWIDRFDPLPGRGPEGAGILIYREESPEQTSSGLWIPQRYREAVKGPVAVVVRSADPRARPGDVVLVAEGAGRRVKFGDIRPTIYYLVVYAQLRLRFARVVESAVAAAVRKDIPEAEQVWREVASGVEQAESMHRLHLNEDILLSREDVVDQGLATAIGDQRGVQK